MDARQGVHGGAAGRAQGLARRLRTEPVLAETAVEITAQHAEGERPLAGVEVEEGLLLDRVRVQPGHVAPGRLEHAVLVEAHHTAVSAG
jgi:hypothetical protein